MITASGSNFRESQMNFLRAMQNKEPQGIAQSVALTFMGARGKVAEGKTGRSGRVLLPVGYRETSEWKILRSGESGSDNGLPAEAAMFPDGTAARLSTDRDPRETFADWLVDAKNPWFARNAANRVWSWLLGRGIIHEPDDIRDDIITRGGGLARFAPRLRAQARGRLGEANRVQRRS